MNALAAGVGESFRDAVLDGPLLLAVPIAAVAGLVSFLSPCVLPLVPGYLSYITGLSGAELAEDAAAPAVVAEHEVAARGSAGTGTATIASAATHAPPARLHPHRRVLLGGTLFVLGFSVVFVTAGALFGGLGAAIQRNSDWLTRVLGVVTILLGLAFAGVLGRVPWLSRDMRIHHVPTRAGLAGAPVLGFFFGLGWTPCIGPTLGAVLTLAADSASAGRGAVLAFAYCVGLGVPFVVAGLAFRRATATFAVVKRHYRAVMMAGGSMLVVIGLLQVTGTWDRIVIELQTWITGFTPAV